MSYLGDTSAIVRISRRQADERWTAAAERGLIRICDPVLAEVLLIAPAKRYDEFEDEFLARFPWVGLPDGVWRTVAEVRRALARKSEHQGLSVADLLVVATAMHHQLTVLYDDADFDTVAKRIDEFTAERI